MLRATGMCKITKAGRSGYKWPKVEEAWEHFFPDQPYVEQHRALDDALHEAKIAYAISQESKKKRVNS